MGIDIKKILNGVISNVLNESENVVNAEKKVAEDKEAGRRTEQREIAGKQEKEFNNKYASLTKEKTHATPETKTQEVETKDREKAQDAAKEKEKEVNYPKKEEAAPSKSDSAVDSAKKAVSDHPYIAGGAAAALAAGAGALALRKMLKNKKAKEEAKKASK